MLMPGLQETLSRFEPIVPNRYQWELFNHEPDLVERIPGIRLLGNMPYYQSSREISKSPLGIGFETLDRDTFDPAELYPVLEKSGVKYARCQTGWMKCEKIPGQYDFRWLDDIVDNLLAAGIEPWFSLSFGHPVHTPSPRFEAMRQEAEKNGMALPGAPRGYVGEVPYLHGEKAMAAWSRYVKALCGHFQGRVHIWEVWNEPDGATFWRCKGEVGPGNVQKRAEDYTDFVRLTGAVVRSVLPDARICAVCAAAGNDYTVPFILGCP